jgi:predicted PurR-regulated permease PerM
MPKSLQLVFSFSFFFFFLKKREREREGILKFLTPLSQGLMENPNEGLKILTENYIHIKR